MIDKLKKNPKLAIVILAVIAVFVFAIYRMFRSSSDKPAESDTNNSNEKKGGMKASNPLETQIARILNKQYINTGINTAESD